MEEKNVLSIHFSSIISLTQLLQPIKLYLSIKIYTLIVSVKKKMLNRSGPDFMSVKMGKFNNKKLIF